MLKQQHLLGETLQNVARLRHAGLAREQKLLAVDRPEKSLEAVHVRGQKPLTAGVGKLVPLEGGPGATTTPTTMRTVGMNLLLDAGMNADLRNTEAAKERAKEKTKIKVKARAKTQPKEKAKRDAKSVDRMVRLQYASPLEDQRVTA